MAVQPPFVPFVGSESEYGLHAGDSYSTVGRAMMYQDNPELVVPCYRSSMSGRMWFTNGACAYLDYNDHPEYATPECWSPAELAIHEWVGPLVMQQLFKGAYPAPLLRPMLLKNNTGPGGESTFGNHLNILMPLGPLGFEASLRSFALRAAGLVATMPLVTGAGLVHRRTGITRLLLDGSQYAYRLSARSHFIGRVISSASTNDETRAMFLQRDEALATPNEYWRLQLLSFDANMLPAAIELKTGIMMLAAMLWAAGRLKPLHLENPLQTLRDLSRNWRLPVRMREQRSRSAVRVQRFYLRQAEQFVARHNLHQFQPIIDRWRFQLNAFTRATRDGDDFPAELEGHNDWVTKLLWLRRREARLGGLSYAQAEQIQHQYHGFKLGAGFEASVPFRFLERFGPPGFLAAVQRAATVPPTGRAALRGAFVQLARQVAPDVPASINWNYVNLKDHRVNLNEPLAPSRGPLAALWQQYMAEPPPF